MVKKTQTKAKDSKKSPSVVLAKKSNKPTDQEKVSAYMKGIKHSLKVEMEAVRSIIKDSDKRILERIKWNAPSYCYKPSRPGKLNHSDEVDLVTFNGWATKNIHLVFHHAAIVKIKSGLLEGDYKDRRMAYFKDMADIESKKKELQRIMKELVKLIDKK